MNRKTLALATVFTISCDPADSETLREHEPVDAAEIARPAVAPPRRVDNTEAHRSIAPPPRRALPGARAVFDDVMALIDEHYVDGALDDDALWTAAIDGVMGRLIQHGDHRINALLSAEEFNELKIGTSGELIGIGVIIERVADVVVIRDLLPGGPAARAELQPGDRILGIGGERLKGKTLAEVVDAIRGEAGTTVELFVQRDTEEWDTTLTREAIAVPNVQSSMVGDDVGYVHIDSFAKNTVEDFDAAMLGLAEAGMAKLVLDLRDCPGGLLDGALGVSERLLVPGKRIVSVRSKGDVEEHLIAKEDNPYDEIPLAILTNAQTASGAEIIAEAMSFHGRALVIGEPTFGKGTVESVHELPEGWGVKLSVSRFVGPSGEFRHGEGVPPDLHIPADPSTKRAAADQLDARRDPQLRAALGVLAD